MQHCGYQLCQDVHVCRIAGTMLLMQVKKEGFKINANIKDVGLTEHKKCTNKKWSLRLKLKK